MKTTKNPRNYQCRDEELPVIGGYVLISIRRDLATFLAYSPVYDDEAVAALEQAIAKVEELVNPRSETNELKVITGRLYAVMDDLGDKARFVEGYVAMSKNRDRGAIPITAKDFGLTALKQRVKARDAEGVMQNARLVMANMEKYREPLIRQGLTDGLVNDFADRILSVSENNRLQYDITTNRKAIVQANLDTLNDLSSKIKEICANGKILFKSNAGKLKEYTWVELKKRVNSELKSGNRVQKEK